MDSVKIGFCSKGAILSHQSQAKKVGIVQKLLTGCVGTETRFIIRSLEGKLRIGLAEKTLVTALAHAMVLKSIGELQPDLGVLPNHPLTFPDDSSFHRSIVIRG
jgi:DNA ligase-1